MKLVTPESEPPSEMLTLEPENVTPREREGFNAGVRIVEVIFSHEFREQFAPRFFTGRANGNLVLRIYIFLNDMVPMRALFIIAKDVRTDTEGYHVIIDQLRKQYGLTNPTMPVEYAFEAVLFNQAEGMGPIEEDPADDVGA